MRTCVSAIFFLMLFSIAGCNAPADDRKIFDGKRAFQHVTAQLNFGARPAGSAASRSTGDYVIEQMRKAGLKIEVQEFTYRNLALRNIVGKMAEGRGPIIIVGAHYDTRLRADQDKLHPEQPVLGANDGASGVAALLELAWSLDAAKLRNEVWLAFFDAEDNGGLSGCIVTPKNCDISPWPWSVGADYFAEHLTAKPRLVVILDMIGDAGQNIYYEHNSDKETQEQLWSIAGRLGYSAQFVPEYKWSMDDDHTPFLERGIRAVDLIDFDYPYWHTVQDTLDKVSPDSLERVGRVMKTWLEGEK